VSLERLRASLADRYAIDRELGQGGMATVYLAHDLKHERKVAIKVLKPDLAAVLGAERFITEIKTTAALSHPHILPLFDSGTVDGRGSMVDGVDASAIDDRPLTFLFYVMPYIEGETIRDRLNRETQLGIDEAVRITREVADALDYAHRHGVIHRDIKPENILLHDGRAMVMDFGIALAVSAAAGGRMTETGLSLGTPHYMSPEQATADREITGRSDIYSLGSVLYEMLTGEPPHMGTSAQQIIMKIVTEDAQPVTRLRKSVSPNVAAAVAKALEKLPADRFESAKAFAEALANPGFTSVHSTRVAATPGTRRAGIVVLGVAAAALGMLAAVGWLRSPEPPRMMLLDLGLQGISPLSQAEISGDGSVIALPGVSPEGQVAIYVREMGSRTFTAIPGTEDVQSRALPSDDGSEVLYTTARGSIQRVTRAGSRTTVRDVDPGARVQIQDWGADGTILFSTEKGLFLRTGSRDVPVDTVGAHRPYGEASLLPDQGILLGGVRGLRVLEPDGSVTPVMDGPADGVYLDDGWLLFTGQRDVLSAAPFSLKGRRLDAAAIVEVASDLQPGARAFSASRTGTIVLALGGGTSLGPGLPSVLELIDPSGSDRALTTPDVGRSGPKFDPTGNWISYQRNDGSLPGQLWVRHIDSDDETQLTFEGENQGGSAIWSPQGDRLLFPSRRDGSDGRDLYSVRIDRPGSAAPVLSLPGDQRPLQWLPGNRVLMYSVDTASDNGLLLTLALNSGVLDTFPENVGGLNNTSLAGSPGARVSPDGTLIAFRSEFAGNTAFWVREFPEPSGRYLVPATAGFNPAWSPDGATLYSWVRTVGPDSLIAVSVDRTAGVRFSNRRVVHVSEYRGWALHPDGRRFIVTNPATVHETAGQFWRTFGVLSNWDPER
jgi:serine/threonine-protein kinase